MKTRFVGLLAVSLTLLVVLCFASEARRTTGKPAFSAGMPRRFVVWDEGGVFKIRTTTAKVVNRFSGAIHVVDGRFMDIRVIRLDKGDFVKRSQDGRRIYFSFTTNKGVDGLNFTAEGKSLVFFLKINGREALPKAEIFLGEKGTHPLRNPFVIGLRGADKDETVTGIEEGKPDGTEIEVKELVPQGELEAESEASD